MSRPRAGSCLGLTRLIPLAVLAAAAAAGCGDDAGQRPLDVTWDFSLLSASNLPPPAKPVVVQAEKTPPFHEYLGELAGPFETVEAATEMCQACHSDAAGEVMKSIHWTWKGATPEISGREGEAGLGKLRLLNNFFIGVPSNEGYCSTCHVGTGWENAQFDFTDEAKVDCLTCHADPARYGREEGGAGKPRQGLNLALAAQSVGLPSRASCGSCHFFAEGGDNVKSGDLASSLVKPQPEDDVHMGRLDFRCQTCHKTTKHIMAGSAPHLGVSDARASCTDCHQGGTHVEPILNHHADRIACQTCHIPRFSRKLPTLVYWDWSTAGRQDAPGSRDEYGKPAYDPRKGSLGWGKDIRPTLAWWNGKSNRMLIGDAFTSAPVDLASPVGSVEDAKSRLYPFKVTHGKQAADAVSHRLLVPHLHGEAGGPKAFWKSWDWDAALREGAAKTGIDYSGKHEWVETRMYIPINHEVAPKEMALQCDDCHNGGIDFRALGYDGDPKFGGVGASRTGKFSTTNR